MAGNKINIDKHLIEIVGQGYRDFWNFRGRYRVVKGSRASKKSKTAALWFIYHMMKHAGSNTLVVRKVFSTLKDSCFTELKWAIERLGVSGLWKTTESPLSMVFIPTGQRIIFRGLDDPLKNTSLTVKVGHLCWMWIEEAYEVLKESDFDTIDESIRGMVPTHLFKQVTLTFNPWNEKSWIKKRFFDCDDDPNILSKTTNYMCNEFLDDADYALFLDMKTNNPKRYKVAGLGRWGLSEGLVFDNFKEQCFDYKSKAFRTNHQNLVSAFGLDFGYTNDPTALFCGLLDGDNKQIFVFDEIYEKGLSNKRIYEKIVSKGYRKEKIRADCSEPKSIADLRDMGLRRIIGARKGKDSVNNGISHIRDYKIIIHPRCVNFLSEINNYMWDKDQFGGFINRPIDGYNHLMDAMRYALEDVLVVQNFSFK